MPKSGRVVSKRCAIAEGLNDKRVWDEAEELDAWLESCLMDGLDDDECESPDHCDWCGHSTLLCGELVSTRDMDEGMSGPVYRVCRKCYAKQQADLQAEYDRLCLELDNSSFYIAS